ncbi:MAG: hypothetical protein K6T94_12920 [Paenibacillus sp.]|nr:hypothetical protein [Paenibacillus sp.]
MAANSTIRSEIESFMVEQGLTMQGFADKSGVNRGTLSAIINRNPPRKISVRELDHITMGMGLSEGTFYPLYLEECFVEAVPHWRRLRPYFMSCAQLGRMDCIERLLELLADDLSHLPEIFTTAELLMVEGYKEAAAALYKVVVECEKFNYSERLAISRYRLFKLNLGLDTEANLWAALRFEPSRGWLPVGLQLDAIYELMKIYYSVHKWIQLEKMSDELITLARSVHQQQQNAKESGRHSIEPLQLQRSLIHYFGQGYLSKGIVLHKMGFYEEAKVFIAQYADLSWLLPQNSTEQDEVQKYRTWAKANSYTVDLLMGRTETLEPYTNYLISNPSEVLPGLVIILQSANKYDFLIDDLLQKFTSEISNFSQYIDSVSMERRMRFCIQLTMYHLHKGRFIEGIESCLLALDLSLISNDQSVFAEAVSLFESSRDYAKPHQVDRYKRVMEQVRERTDSKYLLRI